MRKFILERIAYALVSLILLTVTIFVFVRISGDPAQLVASPTATPAEVAQIRQQLGLDRPYIVQFVSFITGFVRGDLGNSFYYGVPVMDLYLSRLPASLLLAFVALAFSLIIGLPLGVIAAVNLGGIWDRFGSLIALFGMSLPSFWIGLTLILVFSVDLGWLPASGSETPLHLIMPAVTIGWYFAAAHMRLTRSSMLEVLGTEYVKLARLKGLPEYIVIGKHALRNALIPLVTFAGLNLVHMINASIVVETVFAWPGVGRLLYEGVSSRDFPVVQGVVLLGGAMIILVNLLVDLLYAVIDPRIRLGR